MVDYEFIDTIVNIITNITNTIIWFLQLLVLGFAASFAWHEYNTFKKRNLIYQWMTALSGEYHEHCIDVKSLIEKNKHNPEELINQIDKFKDLRKSVEYVLDYLTIKATGVKYNIIDRDLAIRLAKYDVIFFYEGLSPWIKKQKEQAMQRSFFINLEWFYEQCIEECKKRNSISPDC